MLRSKRLCHEAGVGPWLCTRDLYDSFLFFDNGFKARVKTGWIHYIEGGVENRDIYNGARGQVH